MVTVIIGYYAKCLFLIGQIGSHMMDRNHLFKNFLVDNVGFVKNLASFGHSQGICGHPEAQITAVIDTWSRREARYLDEK